MAATAPWQPKEEGFTEICGLLEQQISHSSSSADKSQIWQQLTHYSQFPDFNNYLAFILARAEVLQVLSFFWLPEWVFNTLLVSIMGMPRLYFCFVNENLLGNLFLGWIECSSWKLVSSWTWLEWLVARKVGSFSADYGLVRSGYLVL